MKCGVATMGTVVAVKRGVIRGGWPVVPQRVRDLPQGQSVALHYRQKWPSLAVIDDVVR